MKVSKIAVLLITAHSIPAFAGGSSTVGPSACSYQEYTCTSSDESIAVCPSADKTLESFELKNGGSLGLSEATKEINPTEYPEFGADVEFRGENFVLLIDTHSAPTGAGLNGWLTVFNAGLNKFPVHCQKNK